MFQNKTAVQAVSNNLFLSLKPDSEGYIHAVSRTAGDNEIVNVSLLRKIFSGKKATFLTYWSWYWAHWLIILLSDGLLLLLLRFQDFLSTLFLFPLPPVIFLLVFNLWEGD